MNKVGDILNSSYLPQKEAQSVLERHKLKLDKDLSSMESKVFVDENTNRPIIIHRGTTNVKDVIDDGLISLGLGKYASRTKNADRLALKLENKYGKNLTYMVIV